MSIVSFCCWREVDVLCVQLQRLISKTNIFSWVSNSIVSDPIFLEKEALTSLITHPCCYCLSPTDLWLCTPSAMDVSPPSFMEVSHPNYHQHPHDLNHNIYVLIWAAATRTSTYFLHWPEGLCAARSRYVSPITKVSMVDLPFDLLCVVHFMLQCLLLILHSMCVVLCFVFKFSLY